MKRQECMVCGLAALRSVYKIHNFPAYMGVTSLDPNQDKFFDQTWQSCENCKCLQLESPIDYELLYSDNHHHAPIGTLWKNHHVSFRDFISSSLGTSEKILEIGAADGYLASLIGEDLPGASITVIEPAPTTKASNITVIKDFIENQMDLIPNFKVIIHSHVLEHIYSPRDFFESLAEKMLPGARLFISIPNINELLVLSGANSLNFEHTYYLDGEVVVFWAKQCGLKVLRTKNYLSHSIFFELIKIESHGSTLGEESFRISSNPTGLFIQMWERIRAFSLDANTKLSESQHENFVFGAHVFTQALIAGGLNSDLLFGVLDNDNFKQGKRLYGTSLLVRDPSVIAETEKPNVVLAASHYQTEIKEQLNALNPNTRFLELT